MVIVTNFVICCGWNFDDDDDDDDDDDNRLQFPETEM
jgi:hypothetical protein